MTHNEIAKMANVKFSCSAWDLFSSSGGTQCGNCLAYTMDHGKTWQHPKIKGTYTGGKKTVDNNEKTK